MLRRSREEPPTLATVAEAAGVSRQTVSNAVNNPELLRPDTLSRVRAVIEKLGYQPNRAARQLRTRTSHLIGMRVDPSTDRGSELMDRFVHSLVRSAGRDGKHVLLFSGNPDNPVDGYDALLRSTAVDAFVVTDTYAGTPQVALLKERGAPFVTFGRPWGASDADVPADWAWVDVDGAHGARIATEHAFGAGYRRVAWLGWDDTPIGEDRRSGWEAATRDAGRDPEGLFVTTTDNADAARMAAHRALESPGVDAFCCASDPIAIGVLHALAERGLRPGTDVGVTGFDDSFAARVSWPGLTSVRVPLEDVAERLVVQISMVLSHRPIHERGVMLQPTLKVRGSSRRS